MKKYLNETCGLSKALSGRLAEKLIVDKDLYTIIKIQTRPHDMFSAMLSELGISADDSTLVLRKTHLTATVLPTVAAPSLPRVPVAIAASSSLPHPPVVGESPLIQPLSSAASPSLSSSTFHIMISYNWDHKHIAHAMYQWLTISRRYSVWLDDYGSPLVTKMMGSSNEKMAEAVEKSEFVMMLVSPQYFQSAACQNEAEYAKQKKKKLVFIMLDPNYTTVSSPSSVSGWLGLMIGAQIWYPCFNVADAPALADKLADDVFKDSCRL